LSFDESRLEGGSLTVADATLVLETLKGDKTAFSGLYDRYARLVRAICNDTTRDLGQAQDLGQEVFLRAYSKLDKLNDPDRFGAWLVSITRNVCREYRRGKFRDRHVLVGLAPDEDEQATEKDSPDERLLDLKEALNKLSEKERLALHVYYLQEQDAEQAQKILNISRSGLYRLLAKAREKIERHLTQSDKT